MPDQVLRYRLELDSAGMLSQLAGVEAQAGSQISQMVRPIESATAQVFQGGAQTLLDAQAMSMRAQQGSFFAQNLSAAGIDRRGLFMTGLAAAGFDPLRNYQYTPREAQYLAGQDFGRRIEAGAAAGGRAAMELGGGIYGSALMGGLGWGVGRSLFGLPGAVAGWLGGGALGAAAGQEAYGPMGGAGIGGLVGRMAMGGPGALLGAFAGTVLGTGAQLGIETLGARGQIRPVIEGIGAQAMPFGSSENPLGTGFSARQLGRATDDVLRMASRDWRYNLGDYAKIMEGGRQAGAYDSANTTQKFTETTRQLVDDVKLIQTALRRTLDDSISTMQQLQAAGITSRDKVRQYVVSTRGLSMATGLEPAQLQQAGLLGQAAGMGYFYGETGDAVGRTALAGARRMRQVSGVRDQFGQDITRELIGAAGGETQLGADTARTMLSYLQSGTAKTLMAGMYDPATRGLDQEQVSAFLGGRTDLQRTFTRGAYNLQTPMAMARFHSDFEGLVRKMTPGQQSEMMLATLREQTRLTLGNTSEEAQQAIWTEEMSRLGYGPMKARAMLHNLRNVQGVETQGEMATASFRIDQQAQDRERERGVGGFLRRVKKSIGGYLTDKGIEVTEGFVDPIRAKAENWFNKTVLGTSGEAFPTGDPGDITALSSAGLAPSEALRDVRARGVLSKLQDFLPASTNAATTYSDKVRARLATSGAGTLPGYGEIAYQPEGAKGPGMAIRDTMWSGTQTFMGTDAQFRKAEAENVRLAALPGLGATPASEAVNLPVYSEVQKKISGLKGKDVDEYIRDLRFSGGAAPSFTSMTYGVGEKLGYTKEQLDNDKDLRDAVAYTAAKHLTESDLDAMKKGVIDVSMGPAMVEELNDKATEARDYLKATFKGTKVGEDIAAHVPHARVIMKTASSKDYSASAPEDILQDAGYGTRNKNGTFDWRSGIKKEDQDALYRMAKGFRGRGDLPALLESVDDMSRAQQAAMGSDAFEHIKAGDKKGVAKNIYADLAAGKNDLNTMSAKLQEIAEGNSTYASEEVQAFQEETGGRLGTLISRLNKTGAETTEEELAGMLTMGGKDSVGVFEAAQAKSLATSIKAARGQGADVGGMVLGTWGKRRAAETAGIETESGGSVVKDAFKKLSEALDALWTKS